MGIEPTVTEATLAFQASAETQHLHLIHWRRVDESNVAPFNAPGVQAQFATLAVPSIGGMGGNSAHGDRSHAGLADRCRKAASTSIPCISRSVKESNLALFTRLLLSRQVTLATE